MKTGQARPNRALFLQGADPAFYPPIMHAAAIMAGAGWRVTVLSTPRADSGIEMAAHPAIDEIRLRPRPSFRIGARDYIPYCLKSLRLAFRLRPDVVYASDPLGAAPGLLAAQAGGSLLVYHEHDSPGETSGHGFVRRARRLAARKADLVVFPNAGRAELSRPIIRFKDSALRIVWNLPALDDLPVLTGKPEAPVVVYYHGNITPERLPESVPAAISRFGGAAVLKVAGYEAPSGEGYVTALERRWGRCAEGGLIDRAGPLPYRRLLEQASRCHIGLALMPMASNDINMRHMAGASNKAFDYMAAGLALVVSDLPGWRDLFVERGHAMSCDPRNADSVEAALRRLIGRPGERARMADLSRRQIERFWHYEAFFGPILAELDETIARRSRH